MSVESVTSCNPMFCEQLMSDMSFRQIDRFCCTTNDCFLSEELENFRVCRVRGVESEIGAHALFEKVEGLILNGKVYKPGSRGYAVQVNIEGKVYFLKSYVSRGFAYSARNAFRRSRALATWCSNWKMYALGLPVPRPVLCMEERNFRLLGRSYLLTECFSETCNFEEAWADAGTNERFALLKETARIFSRMHRHGAVHGDLKWNNILVGCGSAARNIYLVDLDGSRCYSRFFKPMAKKDLNRFLRDLRKNESDKKFETEFLKDWQSEILL